MREKKDINIQVGNEIRIARERSGLTQEQFAELLSLGTKNISAIECGVSGISITTLSKICKKLFISADTIIFGDAGKNDVAYITERLERLSPEQFAAVKDFLDHTLLFFSRQDQV